MVHLAPRTGRPAAPTAAGMTLSQTGWRSDALVGVLLRVTLRVNLNGGSVGMESTCSRRTVEKPPWRMKKTPFPTQERGAYRIRSPRLFCRCQSHRRVLTPRSLILLPTSLGSLAGWLVAGPASYRSIGAIPGLQVRSGRSALRMALRAFQHRTILRGFPTLHGGSIPPGSTAQASLCEACFVIS